MIKRLIAAALFCVIAVPAWAAMNIQQDGDGTANWKGQNTGTLDHCVGGVDIIRDVQLNKAAIHYVPVPVDRGVLKNIWGVINGANTGTATVRFFVNETNDAIQFTNAAASQATDVSLAFTNESAGAVERISTIGEVSGATKLSGNALTEGQYLAIAANSGAGEVVTAAILVRICPR